MSLYMDRVPNVKIMFARILKEQKLANGPLYFDKELNKAIQWLKSDPDSDVGYEVRGLHVSLAVEDEMSEERKGVSSKTVSGQDESGSEVQDEENRSDQGDMNKSFSDTQEETRLEKEGEVKEEEKEKKEEDEEEEEEVEDEEEEEKDENDENEEKEEREEESEEEGEKVEEKVGEDVG